ncbi:helix-turn-helix domain-containing protein [Paenibacillus sp. P26]|nr:helix-turn-helix domain-containing protein [Paenibacillus sp. P26]
MEALSKGTASIKQTIVGSALLLLLLSVALAYLSSRRLYLPISRLNALIGGRPERKPGRSDEIHDIGSFVQTTIVERDFYKERLEESLPFHRERFKYSLLHPHSLTEEEVIGKLAYLGIDIDTQDLAVLLLALDGDRSLQAGGDMITSDLFSLRVIDAVESSGAPPVKHFVVDTGKDQIAVVLGENGMDRQRVFQLAQKPLDVLKLRLNSDFTIGVGRVAGTICEPPQAYEEALEALKYRMIYGKGYVISIDDVMIDSGNELVYPKQKAEPLFGYVKTAREAEALQMLADLVADIDARKNKLHYNQIQPLFVQSLTGFMSMYHQLGTDIRAVVGGGADPYRELLDQDSLDKISLWFRQLIHMTTAYIEREMNAKGNHHIARVVEILERDYSRDISLNSVAEQLNLNPAYISRLFKQITGQPFVEYLKRVRIEKSKELLAEGNLKINEIGRQVGYGDSYYFIKVFKEIMGLTPGEYKKMVGS